MLVVGGSWGVLQRGPHQSIESGLVSDCYMCQSIWHTCISYVCVYEYHMILCFENVWWSLLIPRNSNDNLIMQYSACCKNTDFEFIFSLATKIGHHQENLVMMTVSAWRDTPPAMVSGWHTHARTKTTMLVRKNPVSEISEIVQRRCASHITLSAANT